MFVSLFVFKPGTINDHIYNYTFEKMLKDT